jgi:hypothetical protein
VPDDPPTDPVGFPAVDTDPAAVRPGPPDAAPGPPGPSDRGAGQPVRTDAAPERPGPADAAATGVRAATPDDARDGVIGGSDRASPQGIDPALARAVAAAFAADYLSWDEDDPGRRGDALADHLPETLASAVRGARGPGWSGEGRQRSEIALPGALHDDSSDARLLVDVRVRVTPYARSGTPAPAGPAARSPDPLGSPAAAPAPSAPGWTGLPARWVRISVPVRVDGDRLVVDPDEELLAAGGEPPVTP